MKNQKRTHIGKKCFWFKELPSTNDYIKAYAETLEKGTAVVADFQSKGKGRREKEWIAEKGSALLMSIKLCAEGRPVSPVTLCVALGVANALSELTNCNFEIKWPNDLLMNGKKLCGILCETIGKNDIVAGIGLNLKGSAEYFEKNGLPSAASVRSECKKTLTRKKTAAAIFRNLERVFDRYISEGFEGIKEDYLKYSATVGREVSVIDSNGGIRRGKACGIENDGSLTVDFDGKIERVFSGEVSIRMQ